MNRSAGCLIAALVLVAVLALPGCDPSPGLTDPAAIASAEGADSRSSENAGDAAPVTDLGRDILAAARTPITYTPREGASRHDAETLGYAPNGPAFPWNADPDQVGALADGLVGQQAGYPAEPDPEVGIPGNEARNSASRMGIILIRRIVLPTVPTRKPVEQPRPSTGGAGDLGGRTPSPAPIILP